MSEKKHTINNDKELAALSIARSAKASQEIVIEYLQQMISERTRLITENLKLTAQRDELLKYTWHTSRCDEDDDGKCTCGYLDLIAKIEQETDHERRN